MKTNLTDIDKANIAARCFYDDNRDEYEDFKEAQIDFMGKNKPSAAFIETVMKMNLEVKKGHKLFLCHDGLLAHVRLSDGFFDPYSTFSEEDGQIVQEQFQKVADENPDVKDEDLLPLMPWKEIKIENAGN